MQLFFSHHMFFDKRFLLKIALIMFSVIFIAQNIEAADEQEKQSKKDAKNIELIEKELKAGQVELIKEFGGKNALDASKKATRYYQRLSDQIKSSTEVSNLKTELDAFAHNVKVKLSQEKTLKQDQKYLKSAHTDLKKLASYLELYSESGSTSKLQHKTQSKFVASARRALNSATTAFKKISALSLPQKDFIDTRSQIDDFAHQIEIAEAELKEKEQLSKVLLVKTAEFKTYLAKHKILDLLAKGRKKTAKYQLIDAEILKDSYETANFEVLEQEFKKDYAALIQHRPDLGKGYNLTPNDVLDIYENKVRYRDQFIVQHGKNHLDWKLNILKKVESTLNEKGYLLSVADLLEELYGTRNNEPFAEVSNVERYYDWVDVKLPEKEINLLAEHKKSLNNVILQTAQKHEWEASKYPYSNIRIEKIARAFCSSLDTNLVNVGVVDENAWRIKKNARDIPLKRDVFGFVLCQHPNEPFKRGYQVGFSSTFNGIGYEPISSVYRLNRVMVPHS